MTCFSFWILYRSPFLSDILSFFNCRQAMGSKKECNNMLKESRYEDEIKTDKKSCWWWIIYILNFYYSSDITIWQVVHLEAAVSPEHVYWPQAVDQARDCSVASVSYTKPNIFGHTGPLDIIEHVEIRNPESPLKPLNYKNKY